MEKKLQRNEQEKSIGGVCAGLADYFNVDVTWIRIGFVLAVLAGLSGLLAYVVLWIAVPARPNPRYGQFNADYKVYDSTTFSQGTVNNDNFTNMPPYPMKKKSGSGRVIMGLLFLMFGVFFLLDGFGYVPFWFEVHKLWPLALIIPGFLMITKANRKSWKEELKDQQRTEQEAAASATGEAEPITPEETDVKTDENSTTKI